jgi:hypothetical protein
MNQLYDEVIATQAALLADLDLAEPRLAGSAAVFRREGEYWTIGFQGVVVHVRDAKGLRYLRRLLAAPGCEFHVRDLAAGTNSPAQRARANVGKSLRACLKRIETAHPALGAHLAATIRTGYFCSYQPDPGVHAQWRT